MNRKSVLIAGAWLAGFAPSVSAQYPGWQHEGAMFILTTPEGADPPASALERDFPLWVRLSQRFLDFRQARPNGEDLRFPASGQPLAYQVEAWDPVNGLATLSVGAEPIGSL